MSLSWRHLGFFGPLSDRQVGQVSVVTHRPQSTTSKWSFQLPTTRLLARNNFRLARDGETIYGNFITAAETRGGNGLTSRLGCRSAAMVLAAD
jgi:hypothetical protein